MSESFGESSEKRTIKTLCRLCPSPCTNAKYVQLQNGESVVAISSVRGLVYILDESSIQGILNVGSPVTKFLDYNDKGKLWIITEDGKLWAVSVSQSKHLEHKNSNLEKSEAKSRISNTNYEIFTELLANDDPFLKQPSTTEMPTSDHMTSSQAIMQCSEENIIHFEPSLQDVAIGAAHITTCCTRDDGIRITIYPQTDSSKELTSSSLDHMHNYICLSPNLIFRTVLATDHTINSNHGNCKDATVLLHLEPGDETSSNWPATIDERLFYALFRRKLESNLPVVLVGRSSGLVGFLSVGQGRHDSNGALEVLYHLEQPVKAMFTACLTPSDTKEQSHPGFRALSNTLVLIGGLGKLVLITLQDSEGLGSAGVQFHEYHVPGPIVCTAFNQSDILYYSTLKEVFAVQLRCVQKSDGGDGIQNQASVPSCLLPSSLSPILISIPKVSALAVKESGNATGSLTCVKTNGCVLLIQIPLINDKIAGAFAPNQSSPLTSGDKIKQYLTDMKQKTDTVNHLRQEIQELDDVIKQLNIVTHILCGILRTQDLQAKSSFTKSCSKDPGISFFVEVDYEAQGGFSNPRVILRCVLVNSTKFCFSKGWSLVIQVHMSQPWFNQTCVAPLILNHSISLDSSPKHHLSIPLETSTSFLPPVNIRCFICLDTREIVPAQFQNYVNSETGLAVQVSSLELNILNFLRNANAAARIPAGRKSSNQINILQQTLRNLSGPRQNRSSFIEQSSKMPEYSTLSIELSKQAVDFICEHTLETRAQSNSEKLSILQFFLSGSKKHLDFSAAAVQGNSLVMRTPDEDEVKFQVVDVNQGGGSTIRDGLQLRVHTTSDALRCAVHSALLSVVKPVFERNVDKMASVPVDKIQRHLNKLKNIQASLDQLRADVSAEDPEQTVQDERQNKTLHNLIAIYNELRKIPTFIP